MWHEMVGNDKDVAHPTWLDIYGGADFVPKGTKREHPLSPDATLLLMFALAMPPDCQFGSGYLFKIRPWNMGPKRIRRALAELSDKGYLQGYSIGMEKDDTGKYLPKQLIFFASPGAQTGDSATDTLYNNSSYNNTSSNNKNNNNPLPPQTPPSPMPAEEEEFAQAQTATATATTMSTVLVDIDGNPAPWPPIGWHTAKPETTLRQAQDTAPDLESAPMMIDLKTDYLPAKRNPPPDLKSPPGFEIRTGFEIATGLCTSAGVYDLP